MTGCGGALYVTGGCWHGNVPSAWYNEWSGFLSIVIPPVISGLVFAAVFYWHHRCHHGRCVRPGRHTVAGSPWCNRHHQQAREGTP